MERTGMTSLPEDQEIEPLDDDSPAINYELMNSFIQNLGLMNHLLLDMDEEQFIDLDRCVDEDGETTDFTSLLKKVLEPDAFAHCNCCDQLRGIIYGRCSHCGADDLIKKNQFEADVIYYTLEEPDEFMEKFAKKNLKEIELLENFFFQDGE